MKITYKIFGVKSINFCCTTMSKNVLDRQHKIELVLHFDKDLSAHVFMNGEKITHCPFCGHKIEAIKLVETEDLA